MSEKIKRDLRALSQKGLALAHFAQVSLDVQLAHEEERLEADLLAQLDQLVVLRVVELEPPQVITRAQSTK